MYNFLSHFIVKYIVEFTMGFKIPYDATFNNIGNFDTTIQTLSILEVKEFSDNLNLF